MKRLIAVLLALALFVATTPVYSGSSGGAGTILLSVRPVAMVNEGVLGNVCSASSISEGRRYWLSAAHCFADPSPRYIGGEAVTVIVLDVANDIAIVSTPTASAPALRLATRAPQLLDQVKVAGYPFGYIFPFVTIGTVAAINVFFDDPTHRSTVFQVAGAPGSSGSVVVNGLGEAVSIIRGGWAPTFSPMAYGVVFEALAKYRAYFS